MRSVSSIPSFLAWTLPLALIFAGCLGGASSVDLPVGTPDGGGAGRGGASVGGANGNGGGGDPVGGGGAMGPGGAAGTPGAGGAAGAARGGAGGGTGTGGAGTGGRVGAGGAGGSGIGGSSGAGGRAGLLRLMPLGDSTTGSVCWRAMLWQMLNQGGFTGRFDFVGSRHNDAGCGVTGYDLDNEGHPSVLVTNFIVDADDLVAGIQTPQALLGQNPADVVLLHFATNDVWNNVAPATILSAYSTVLSALRAANPRVTILVAQLIQLLPVNTATCTTCACPTCDTRMIALNAQIPGWAAANSTATSPIIVVDQHTGFDATTDTVDGVHPNAAGSAKIAARWYSALTPRF
jgi:lysophospholipase L1-like esterase